VYSRDGRPLTTHRLDSQIWIARSLVLAALTRAGSGDTERRLARQWFRAVTAMFAQRLNLADLQPHLADVLKYMPDDPELLVDAGCAAETLASPLIQATIGWREPESTLSGRLPSRPPSGIAPANRPAAFRATAEKHYRAALARAPRDPEARIRLGRVLADAGRHTEALEQLQAVDDASPRLLQYYNFLFLGDVLTDLRRLGDARTAFERAARLYPGANSPRLGISRIESERGDLPAARRALASFIERPPDTSNDDDPRWQYNRCSGRDAHAVYSAYVASFRKEFQ
jgi:tetratricopeptide (TPR) repeat protein